ncbi:VanZ family protein [Actinomyces bowdenii]|uniref:VanZ family protein n=1 Tax=Actinomyces bowdenii TaxID=131109 RepID=A0A3P1V7H7_9ACTO|nr:VanZ family protein [Actinomyces bowdenii]RRD30142.1 VanZ family protein [Actinomyces bowdenii]
MGPGHDPRTARAPRHRRGCDPAAAAPRHQWVARLAALVALGAVALAVLWPSGQHVSSAKDAIGPWFLGPEDKDLVLNLVMLLPLTLCACLGWPRIPWWAWALAGCALGASAELAQWLLPGLDRRPLVANVLENSAGACTGAILAAVLLARRGSGTRLKRQRQHARITGPQCFPRV